jgi:Na+:H+ antiporter, NhaA family
MDHRPRPTWRDSDRLVPRAFVQPALRFMQVEAASGAVMLLAAIAAIVWANSPWRATYEHLWETDLLVRLGGLLDLNMTLREWVNNAAMALFFLLAGLEIKRQLLLGELRNRKAAALPALAALGGMLFPALIYLAINAGHPGHKGWGIPVATDIAFAVGIVTLAGKRVPLGAKIFILTLAIVDDVGGIVVIAVFYAEQVRLAWLAVAAASVVITFACSRRDVRSMVPYIVLGATCWLALYEAGIESAIVGVIFGLLTPVRPFHDPKDFPALARHLVDDVEHTYSDDVITDDERERNEGALEEINRLALETTSPLERVENRLGLWVSLLIVPVFAFANAGVHIVTSGVDGRVFLGVLLGLVIGKTIGVFSFSWLAVRLGIGKLPAGVGWSNLFGLAVTAGIGFTVALFVTSLSFDDPNLASSAKLGVLAASTVAGILGLLALRLLGGRRTPRQDQPPGEVLTPAGSTTA